MKRHAIAPRARALGQSTGQEQGVANGDEITGRYRVADDLDEAGHALHIEKQAREDECRQKTGQNRNLSGHELNADGGGDKQAESK